MLNKLLFINQNVFELIMASAIDKSLMKKVFLIEILSGAKMARCSGDPRVR
jgi:hypothetical protein